MDNEQNNSSSTPNKYHDIATPQSFEMSSKRNSFMLTLTPDPEGAGVLHGAGEYRVGSLVTLEAQPSSHRYVFDAWIYQGIVFSKAPFFTFLIEEDLDLQARFIRTEHP
ncbi:hypothetical protein [Porphyromonas pogonae]|uniref:hypothetical protein n=1 Tax=Porphyromonas pogonae TaxID=867595 RepID=UPI002E76F232|nr:hypothetical protein [Porphyromonas pogonae]